MIRDRSGLPVAARKIELIAPEELKAAIKTIVESSFGINGGEIPAAVARLLGFGRTIDDITSGIDGQLKTMVRKGGSWLSRMGTLPCRKAEHGACTGGGSCLGDEPKTGSEDRSGRGSAAARPTPRRPPARTPTIGARCNAQTNMRVRRKSSTDVGLRVKSGKGPWQ